MKYVQRFVDRHGAERLYLRKKGLPKVPLKSAWPAEGEVCSALELEVRQLLERLERTSPIPGTLRQATRAYELEDPDFRGLAESTKYEYRLLLTEFDAQLGDVPIIRFTPAFVLALRNAWAQRGHRAANVRRQVLKNVLKSCLIAGVLEIDPFAKVGDVRRPSGLTEPHILWPAEVVEAVLQTAIAARRYGLARAVAIARYTGARRGDLVGLTEGARRGGRFSFLSGKRKVLVDIPEDPILTVWLARVPNRQPDEPRRGRKDPPRGVVRLQTRSLVFNLSNERYTEDGLGLELGKLLAAMCKRGELDSDQYDLHGLRHTRGVEIALSGCSDAQGAAMMGHRSPSSFAQYRRQASKVRLSDDAGAKVIEFRAEGLESAVSNPVSTKCQTGQKNETGSV